MTYFYSEEFDETSKLSTKSRVKEVANIVDVEILSSKASSKIRNTFEHTALAGTPTMPSSSVPSPHNVPAP
jgi:hypothetical protein